ncbi:MAG: DUF2244 domain-containing protein [Pseudomonadota bacterium]
MARREWVLKRNCSISPRQLAMAYAALCSISLAVALVFTLRGAWFILGFAFLEMAAVGLAFLQYGRHATDREHIALIDDYLLVELIQAEQSRQFRLDPRHTRVELPEVRGALIELKAGGMRVEVGRFLTEWKRREFAQELRQQLRAAQI